MLTLGSKARQNIMELYAVEGILDTVLQTWPSTKTFGSEKELLKNFRMAYTYVKKGIDILHPKIDPYDLNAMVKLLRQNRLELIPTEEYLQKMKLVKETKYCINPAVARDMAEGIIQAFCNHDCKKKDFQGCEIRNVFIGWGIEPYREVTEKICQYKY